MWLSLERLRQLPLDSDSRCRLLQTLALEPAPLQPLLASPLQLQWEAAEATASGGLDALDRGDWLTAVERQNELRALIAALAERRPETASGLWTRYGELLAGLTAAVHPVVNSRSSAPPEPLLRAELCWRLMELLEDGRRLPLAAPDWLPVLEQQLVQDGAQFWRELIGSDQAPQARARALAMLLRLQQLLDPCPAWVQQDCRGLLEGWLLPLLQGDGPAPAELMAVLPWLERWPLAEERQPALAAAVLRLRLGLELLDQMVARRARPAAATASAASAPSSPSSAAAAAPPAAAAGPLRLVLQRDDRPCPPEACNLAPLLTADLAELDQALGAFLAGQEGTAPALHPAASLLSGLQPLWQSGGRLPRGSFALLSYAAAVWRRRLGERVAPLAPLDGERGLMVELDRAELGVLQAVLERDPALEPALADLRRHHHDAGYWQAGETSPWYGLLSSPDALRLLQRDAGFYAGSAAPLESVRLWAQAAVACLLAAQVWSDDPSCLGPWLALSQQLVVAGQMPPPLGGRPAAGALLQALAGLEVVYVGEAVEAMAALHRQGQLFRPAPFGLRCLAPPQSRHPQRPHGSFEESLALCCQQLEGLHQERPFQVLLTDAGAYRLGLAQALHTRLGVRCVCSASALPAWLAEA